MIILSLFCMAKLSQNVFMLCLYVKLFTLQMFLYHDEYQSFTSFKNRKRLYFGVLCFILVYMNDRTIAKFR